MIPIHWLSFFFEKFGMSACRASTHGQKNLKKIRDSPRGGAVRHIQFHWNRFDTDREIKKKHQKIYEKTMKKQKKHSKNGPKPGFLSLCWRFFGETRYAASSPRVRFSGFFSDFSCHALRRYKDLCMCLVQRSQNCASCWIPLRKAAHRFSCPESKIKFQMYGKGDSPIHFEDYFRFKTRKSVRSLAQWYPAWCAILGPSYQTHAEIFISPQCMAGKIWKKSRRSHVEGGGCIPSFR